MVAENPTSFDERLVQLRALGESTRLRLIRILCRGELTVTELTSATGLSQPGISRHMKLLSSAGLAERNQEGAWVFYRQTLPSSLKPLIADLSDHRLAEDDSRLDRVKAERSATAARYFAKHAPTWDAVRRLQGGSEAGEAAIRSITERLAQYHGGRLGRIVDLGTGTGQMLDLLSGLYDSAIGFDASAEMLSVARSRLSEVENVRVRLRDLYELEAGEEGGADLVLMHHVLHYLADPPAAIAAAVRLSAEGRVLIADFAPHDREELRTEHAHRRLGFSDADLDRWARLAGASVVESHAVPPNCPNGLIAKLWLIERRTKTSSVLRREVEVRPDAL